MTSFRETRGEGGARRWRRSAAGTVAAAAMLLALGWISAASSMATPLLTVERADSPHANQMLATAVGRARDPASLEVGETTTTTYQYNADGALTAITTQAGDGEATTTYLTWDNFSADANDPTTGTVAAANGNLIGYGTSPGTQALDAQFQFDRRDRLIGYTGNGQAATYDYYADGMLASATSGDDDGWQFYYDHSTNKRLTNIDQPSTGLRSGYLGPVRYLSDGTQQALCAPRKDVASVYDPAGQSLSSYRYDAFGAEPPANAAGSYDLHVNPVRYAAELREPMSGAIYLRGRWYHPDLPVFLSRDPRPSLNRYGYGGGNPVTNADPSGLKHRAFLPGLNRGLAAFESGGGGHFARLFLGPFLQPLQLLADPVGYWHGMWRNPATGATGILGAVAEGLASRWALGVGLGWHVFGETSLGLLISYEQSISGGHFRAGSFIENSEFALSSIAWGRLVAGIGYKRGFVSRAEADIKVSSLREHSRYTVRWGRWGTRVSPFTERFGFDAYHEATATVSSWNVTLEGSTLTVNGRRIPYNKVYPISGDSDVDRISDVDKILQQHIRIVGSEEFSRPNFYKTAPRFKFRGSEIDAGGAPVPNAAPSEFNSRFQNSLSLGSSGSLGGGFPTANWMRGSPDIRAITDNLE